MKISLTELREALRTHPRAQEWDDGDEEAIFLLLGAQTIAEYERLEDREVRPLGELETEKVQPVK